MGQTDLLLLSHAAATWAMTGLIWFVQIVHYPLFALAADRRFAAYEDDHARRTSLVVVPLMLAELLTGLLLLARNPEDVLAWTGLGLLGIIWASTFFWQVPQHRVLSQGFDAQAHRRLVAGNWLRSAGWTGRALLVLVLLGRGVS